MVEGQRGRGKASGQARAHSVTASSQADACDSGECGQIWWHATTSSDADSLSETLAFREGADDVVEDDKSSTRTHMKTPKPAISRPQLALRCQWSNKELKRHESERKRLAGETYCPWSCQPNTYSAARSVFIETPRPQWSFCSLHSSLHPPPLSALAFPLPKPRATLEETLQRSPSRGGTGAKRPTCSMTKAWPQGLSIFQRGKPVTANAGVCSRRRCVTGSEAQGVAFEGQEQRDWLGLPPSHL